MRPLRPRKQTLTRGPALPVTRATAGFSRRTSPDTSGVGRNAEEDEARGRSRQGGDQETLRFLYVAYSPDVYGHTADAIVRRGLIRSSASRRGEADLARADAVNHRCRGELRSGGALL